MPLAIVNYRWMIRWQLIAAGIQRLLTTADFFPPKTRKPYLPYSLITLSHHYLNSKKFHFKNLCQNLASKLLMINC